MFWVRGPAEQTFVFLRPQRSCIRESRHAHQSDVVDAGLGVREEAVGRRAGDLGDGLLACGLRIVVRIH